MIKDALNRTKIAWQALKQGLRSFIDAIYLRNVKSTCESITWGDYMKVICFDRFRLMLRMNIYTPKRIIIKGFAMLLEDYNTITTNVMVKTNEEKRDAIGRLSQKQRIVYACYTSLRFRELPHIMQMLRNYMVIDAEDTRLTALNKCVAELKGLDLQLNNLKIKNDTKRPTMSDYEKERQILSKHQGYIIPSSIKLSEYAVIQNLYRDYVEDLKKHNDGTRNH